MSFLNLLGDFAVPAREVQEAYKVITVQKITEIYPLLTDPATLPAAIAEITALSQSYAIFIKNLELALNL